MPKRKNKGSGVTPRMLDTLEACDYTGFGKNKMRSWGMEIGADRHFGRMLRWDKEVIDAALDKMAKAEAGRAVNN